MDKRLDFKDTVIQISRLTPAAQATFLFLLVQVLTPGVLRTLLRYGFTRLDKINKDLPKGHPYKKGKKLKAIDPPAGYETWIKGISPHVQDFTGVIAEGKEHGWGIMNNVEKQERW